MKTKNNTFKRIAAGAIATVSVAANVMSANVGGAVVDSLNAVLVASAANVSLSIDNAKDYLSEITFDGETYKAFKSINTFAVPENSDVVIKATAKLTNFYEEKNGKLVLKDGVEEKFEDGKWVYTYKQAGETTLTVSDATDITYFTAGNPADKILDPTKIVSWKIGNGGELKEYTREEGDNLAADNITGAVWGETVEITSTELLDFEPGVAFGEYDATKNPKPVRTVANGTYTYKFSANTTTISKGSHKHNFDVVGLTADKTALEIKCSDIVDGTHDKPYSVFVSVFNYTKVPGADKATKEAAIANNGANNVVFSEVTDSNFNYGNVAPYDDNANANFANFGFGVYNDSETPSFTTASTFANYNNDNIQLDNGNILITGEDGTAKVYQIGTPVVYDKDNKEVANADPKKDGWGGFYAKLNSLPVGSYTMKYTITYHKQGADIIDEEGNDPEHLGTGDNSSTNKYVIETPMNIVQADMGEENFLISNKDANGEDATARYPESLEHRYWTFEYDNNTRYNPIVQVPAGLREGVDYKLEGDISASRVGEYTIYVVGLGNYNFKYALNWKIVDQVRETDEFIVTASNSVYGDSVYDAVKDSLSFKDERHVYTYYWKPKDQTDNPDNENNQDRYTSKEDWERDLKAKGYSKVTEDLILNANEYTITVLAEDIDTNTTIRTKHDNFLTIRKAPAEITIIGKTVTFDGNSHIEDAEASTVAATVYTLVQDQDTKEWVKGEEISLNDAHSAMIEAAKDIKIDATIVNTFDNAVEPDDELTELAKVIHAGAYKLELNEKSKEEFEEDFGRNYNIKFNTKSDYIHDVDEQQLYNFDIVSGSATELPYSFENCNVPIDQIGIQEDAFKDVWETVKADGVKNYLIDNLFPIDRYEVNVTDISDSGLKKFSVNIKMKAIRTDYSFLTDDTITEFNRSLKSAKMFGFSVDFLRLQGKNDNTLIILPAKLHVEVKKDTYVYNDSIIKPEFTVYGIDNKPITADYYDVLGARSAQGSPDNNTQYYTIIKGTGDYQCSQDAFNWKIINNNALRNAAKVTYGDTSSVLKDGKQRVTYTINRELLKTAPAGTKITDAGLLYYNGVDAGNAAKVDAHKLIDKVGTYIDEKDKTNIVKKAHVSASQLSNNKAALTVNVLDNGYGTVVLGFVEVTDADGNSAIIYAERTVVNETTLKEDVIKPAALNKSYASANVEAEKAAQAAIDVEILPFDINENSTDATTPKVEYAAKDALARKKGYSYSSNDKKNRVTFEIQRSVNAKQKTELQSNLNLKALEDYDYEITEYGLYYYNGLNDIPESALTNQWVGKVPQGQTKNSDKSNVVKMAHVTRESAIQFNDEGILQVNVADNGNGVKARGFVCVTLYKKGTLNTAAPQKIYETTIYSSDKAQLTGILENDKKANKYFDDKNNLEVYKNSVVERKYDEIVKNAINGKIGIDGASKSVKGDNYQAVSIKALDTETKYGFDIVEYGVVYSANENAMADNLVLEKVNGTTIKKESIVKTMDDGVTGSVRVEGTNNKKYRVYLIAKDAEGNSTVIYPENVPVDGSAREFSETAPNT